ncbi:hypothetical protein AB0M43_15155 [Longispora sp. NPDC051575]|uniref:hypothetical protein n=1 Tax=Longispora sp. NPDC051575 TaxID=3154943 RepID=UPI003439FD7A
MTIVVGAALVWVLAGCGGPATRVPPSVVSPSAAPGATQSATPTPSPSPQLGSTEKFAVAQRVALATDALGVLDLRPAHRDTQSTQRLSSELCPGPGGYNALILTGRYRMWHNGDGHDGYAWAANHAAVYDGTSAAQVIDELRRELPGRCERYKADPASDDTFVVHTVRELALPAAPGVTSQYAYCAAMSYDSGYQGHYCTLYLGREYSGVGVVSTFTYSADGRGTCEAAGRRVAAMIAGQLAALGPA